MAREPLSLEQTAKVLAELRSTVTHENLTEIVHKIKSGDPDEKTARLLLLEFCQRAREVRKCMHHSSHTPRLIEFVAERLALFLSGKEPDLVRAFGLRRPTRGRKPKSETRQREETIAARVLEQMHAGKTLDQAAEIVSQKENIHESTARNFYTRNKKAARMLLLYRHLLAPPDKKRTP